MGAEYSAVGVEQGKHGRCWSAVSRLLYRLIAPAVGAITSIGFDHQQWLGETIEAIALEKAGIIKPGMDVIIGAPCTLKR